MKLNSLQEQNLSNKNLATISRRAVAFVIDDFIASIFFIVIFYEQITSFADVLSMMTFIQQNVWVLMSIKVIYHTFFVATNGATLGKYIVKIKVVNEESGELLSWGMALVRALVRTAGEMLLYFTFVFAFGNPKRQTLQDKLAKSVVVNA